MSDMKAKDRRLLQSVKLDDPFGFKPHLFDHFAVTRLLRAGYVWSDRNAWIRLTDAGRAALQTPGSTHD